MAREKLKTAIQFLKEIETEQKKYRLVNNLFIVKYIDDEFCYYIGDFLKGGSANNIRKTNLIKIQPDFNLKYNKKKNIRTTTLGCWRKLEIGFNEKPIEEIKNEKRKTKRI
jgi:hypothetical protein